MVLSVLSWNLAGFDLSEAPGGVHAAQLEVLRGLRPDVACLQELVGPSAPLPAQRMLSLLADAVGMSGAIAVSRDGRFHTAVLWPDPSARLVEVRRIADVVRAALLVTLETAAAGRFVLGSIHLPSSSITARQRDAASLVAACDDDHPIVLAGDWNSVGGDAEYDRDVAVMTLDRSVARLLDGADFTDVVRHLNAPWQPTWGYREPRCEVRIDAFRANEAALPAVRGYWVHSGVEALSDHRPIMLALDTAGGHDGSGGRADGPDG